MGFLNGYRTKIAAAGLFAGGVAAVIHGVQAGDWPGVGTGVGMIGGGLAALGIRFDVTSSVKVGAIGSVFAGLASIALGAAHDFDFGQMTQGLTILAVAFAALGIHFSAPAVQARAARRVQTAVDARRNLAAPVKSAW